DAGVAGRIELAQRVGGAKKELRLHLAGERGGGNGRIEIDQVVNGALLEVGQQARVLAPIEVRRRDARRLISRNGGDGSRIIGVQVDLRRRQTPVGALVVERRQAELLQVVQALRAAGRFPRGLH